MNVVVINGPNINMLGTRQPDIYGYSTWEEIEERVNVLGHELGIELLFFQSNHEGEITDYLQQKSNIIDGIVINPAAFSKYGYAILEAIHSINVPYVEVHLSNIYNRGGWHAESIFTKEAVGIVSGFQEASYELGVRALHMYLVKRNK